MAGASENVCSICKRRIARNALQLRCDCCNHFIHKNCSNLPKRDIENIIHGSSPWSCLSCNETNFPFNAIMDDTVYFESLPISKTQLSRNKITSEKLFSPFDIEDYLEGLDYEFYSDPDSNFFNEYRQDLSIESCYYLESDFNKYVAPILDNKKDYMSFIHVNIRSIKANGNDFNSYLHNLNLPFHCIALTETWLRHDSDNSYTFPGYKSINRTRNIGQGGGVSILLQQEISFKVKENLSLMNEDIECIFIEACLTKKILIGVIYRPPNRHIQNFNTHLQSILENISNLHIPCYILGDTNINLLNHSTHSDTGNYIEIIYSNAFIPLINRPTRVTDHSASLIDHCFTNNLSPGINKFQGILLTDITDHYPVFHIAQLPDKTINNEEYYFKRKMTDKNYSAFHNLILNHDWKSVTMLNTCENAFTNFYSIIKEIFNQAFPICRFKKSYHNRLPWLCDSLKKLIVLKNKLYVVSKKHNTIYNTNRYLDFKRSLRNAMYLAEKRYYNDLIESYKGNSKKTWDTIKTVINHQKKSGTYPEFFFNGCIISEPKMIANKFNDYFSNIGSNLAKKIPSTSCSFHNFLTERNVESIFLKPVQKDEILDIIMSLKNGSPGIDDIPAAVLKYVARDILNPLLHVCQLSLSEGVFPNELKIAKVLPLYKANDPSMFNNYRPISLLSVFSKILEKLMYDRLYQYLIKFNILYAFQFGFQKHKSTYMAIICLAERLITAIEKGEIGIGIFIDFRKAFDTVDHSILLEKLNHYGIRGSALQWLQSYLCDRQQFVEFEGASSDMKYLRCGVPQGSNLGPLLFLLYINDLAHVSPNLFAILFADDSNFFCTGNDIDTLIDIVNHELKTIVSWLNSNKMSLNVDKTHFMIFKSQSKKVSREKNIIINGSQISEVTSTKFLGVMIDSHLTWKPHIDYISKKIAKNIGIIIKARRIFEKDTLLTLYYSFIFPYFNYCIQLWGSTYKSYLDKLVILQKKVIRIIAGVNRRMHSVPIFNNLRVLNLDNLFRYSIGLLMYKYHHGWLPNVLDMFTKNKDIHAHNTRQGSYLHIPKVSSELGKMSFKFQAVKIWNQIFKFIRTDVKIGTFKKYLKTFLIK